MPRIRSIKPEFFTSTAIADLSRDARLTFIGLWTHVDDEGRCLDESRLIKAALWPLDDDMTAQAVDGVLAELHSKGRVVRYEVDGRRYLQIQGWEHQKIDRRKESTIPQVPVGEPAASDRRASDEGSSPDLGGDQGSDLGGDDRATHRRDGSTRRRVIESPTHLVEKITYAIRDAHPGAPPPRNNSAATTAASKLLDALAGAADPDVAMSELDEVLTYSLTHQWWAKKASNAQSFCSNYAQIHADWRADNAAASSKRRSSAFDVLEAL